MQRPMFYTTVTYIVDVKPTRWNCLRVSARNDIAKNYEIPYNSWNSCKVEAKI